MSSTRHATDGEFHQERFCSSKAYNEGLRGHLVAMRCRLLSRKDRELAMFLQAVSHRDGLAKFVQDFLSARKSYIGTEMMFHLGAHKAGRVFGAEEVRKLRATIESENLPSSILTDELHLPDNYYNGEFPLKGETRAYSRTFTRLEEIELDGWKHKTARRYTEDVKDNRVYPATYTGEDFVSYCAKEVARSLEDDLKRWCLDPEAKFPTYPEFPRLRQALDEYLNSKRTPRAAVETEIVRMIYGTCEDALDGGLFLIEGRDKVGKSHATRAWCEANLGLARYIKVPSSSDEKSFFHAIAESLGTANGMSYKKQQIQERVEAYLREVKPLLVFDDAQHCWPMNNRREALPDRLIWIMSFLVENDVPVVLLAGPEFTKDGQIVEQKTAWRFERFKRTVRRYVELPPTMPHCDLVAIARDLLPTVSKADWSGMATYARATGNYLKALNSIALTAKRSAERKGRAVTGEDVEDALDKEEASDTALEAKLQETCRPRAKRTKTPRQQTGYAAIPVNQEERFSERQTQPEAVQVHVLRSVGPEALVAE